MTIQISENAPLNVCVPDDVHAIEFSNSVYCTLAPDEGANKPANAAHARMDMERLQAWPRAEKGAE